MDRRGVDPSLGDVTKSDDNAGHADAFFQDRLFLAGDAVLLEMQFVRDAVTDPMARRLGCLSTSRLKVADPFRRGEAARVHAEAADSSDKALRERRLFLAVRVGEVLR